MFHLHNDATVLFVIQRIWVHHRPFPETNARFILSRSVTFPSPSPQPRHPGPSRHRHRHVTVTSLSPQPVIPGRHVTVTVTAPSRHRHRHVTVTSCRCHLRPVTAVAPDPSSGPACRPSPRTTDNVASHDRRGSIRFPSCTRVNKPSGPRVRGAVWLSAPGGQSAAGDAAGDSRRRPGLAAATHDDGD